jgi:hypothetical protein
MCRTSWIPRSQQIDVRMPPFTSLFLCICQPVYHHVTTREMLTVFSWNLILRSFSAMVEHILFLCKTGKKNNGHLHEDLHTLLHSSRKLFIGTKISRNKRYAQTRTHIFFSVQVSLMGFEILNRCDYILYHCVNLEGHWCSFNEIICGRSFHKICRTISHFILENWFHNLSNLRRTQWPQGLRHELFSLARMLESWVRIPLKAWMSVLCAFILCLCCSVCR